MELRNRHKNFSERKIFHHLKLGEMKEIPKWVIKVIWRAFDFTAKPFYCSDDLMLSSDAAARGGRSATPTSTAEENQLAIAEQESLLLF